MGKILAIAEKRTAGTEFASVVEDDNVLSQKNYQELEEEGKKNGYIEGDKYIVSWSAGHLFREKKPSEIRKDWGLFHKFKTADEYKMPELLNSISKTPAENKTKDRMRKVLSYLFKRSDVESVINMCDADAEGEGIFSDIYNFLGGKKRGLPVYRFWNPGSYKSKTAVKKALETMLPGNDDKYKWLLNEKNSRSNGDYTVGMKLTKAAVEHYNKKFYIGRVKAAVIGIIGNRMIDIKNFKAKKYWTIDASFDDLTLSGFYYVEGESADKHGNPIKTKQKEENFFDLDFLKSVKEKILQVKALEIIKFETKETSNKAPHLPLAGTEFISKMMASYGVTYPQGQKILDKLRNDGFTTYPGTNGNYFFSKEAEMVEEYLATASAYFGFDIPFDANSEIFNDKKADTQNHAPLSVTDKVPTKKDIESWEKSDIPFLREGYEMIAKHFVAKFLDPDKMEEQSLVAKGPDGVFFGLNGSKVIRPGWRRFMGEAKKDTTFDLPDIDVGSSIPIDKVTILERETKPLKEYSLKGLLDTMMNVSKLFDEKIKNEKDLQKVAELKRQKAVIQGARGIGTDRTREAIIRDLFENKILKKKGSKVVLTELGEELYKVCPASLRDIIYTTQWEMKFEDVRNGKMGYDEFVKWVDDEVMHKFVPEIISKAGTVVPIGEERKKVEVVKLDGIQCPLCGSAVLESEKAYRCEKVKFTKKTISGCNFSIPKNMTKTLGRKISGPDDLKELLSSTKDNPWNEGLNSIWFSPDAENIVSVEWKNEKSGNRGDPFAVAETEKTFRMGKRYVYKTISGKKLTLKQATDLLHGKTITMSLKKKDGGTYKVKVSLPTDTNGAARIVKG